MIKRIVVLAAALGTLTLGACSTLNNLPVQITTAASQTQEIAKALCAFEPTVATVAGVIAALYPNGGAIATVASGAASAICDAVTAKSATLRSAAVPTVAGVIIEGRFITKSEQKAAKRSLSVSGVPIEGRFVR